MYFFFPTSKLQSQRERNKSNKKSENEEMPRVKKIQHIEEVALDKEQQQQTRKDILMIYTNYKMY